VDVSFLSTEISTELTKARNEETTKTVKKVKFCEAYALNAIPTVDEGDIDGVISAGDNVARRISRMPDLCWDGIPRWYAAATGVREKENVYRASLSYGIPLRQPLDSPSNIIRVRPGVSLYDTLLPKGSFLRAQVSERHCI
jgi:hypothetical protein